MAIINCEKCGISAEHHAKRMCYKCYKKFGWTPKKKICTRCKNERVIHTKGLCAPCYNSIFQIHKIKEYNTRKRHNIDYLIYKEITKQCSVCGFDKVVDLHHLDFNNKNNSKNNLVGLCPNHHKMLHDRRYRKEVFEELEKKGFEISKELLEDEKYLSEII